MILERVHISRGNTKLGTDIPSVNLPAGMTCRPDAPCFKKCYARKGRFLFPHVRELAETNLQIWREAPLQYEREVMIAAFKAKFFRWHSSGDIPDAEYMEMIVRVAQHIPDTKFLCFTKQYELVNAYIEAAGDLPSNLSIIFSSWGDWKPDNPYGLPVAYIRFKHDDEAIPDRAVKCPKYCGDCVTTGCSCWDLKRGFYEDGEVDCVVFDEH